MENLVNQITSLEETINNLVGEIYKLRKDISENKDVINNLIKKVEEIELNK